MRRTVSLLAVLFALTGLAACGGEDEPSASGEGVSVSDADTGGTASQPADAPAPGSAPAPAPAAADNLPDPNIDHVAAADAAAASLLARFAAADPAGPPPRASDPEVAADLAALFNANYAAHLPAPAVNDLGTIEAWSQKATQVGLSYLLWGTGKATPQELAGDAAASERVGRNTIDYSPELGPYFDFTLRANEVVARAWAAHMPTLDAATLQSEAIESPIIAARAALTQSISAVLALSLSTELTEEWLVARIRSLKAVRDTASTFLPPRIWRTLAERASSIAAAHPNAAIAWELNEFAI